MMTKLPEANYIPWNSCKLVDVSALQNRYQESIFSGNKNHKVPFNKLEYTTQTLPYEVNDYWT